MATLGKCVAEPSGNPPGPVHAARTTHALTHASAIKSTRLLQARRFYRWCVRACVMWPEIN